MKYRQAKKLIKRFGPTSHSTNLNHGQRGCCARSIRRHLEFVASRFSFEGVRDPEVLKNWGSYMSIAPQAFDETTEDFRKRLLDAHTKRHAG